MYLYLFSHFDHQTDYNVILIACQSLATFELYNFIRKHYIYINFISMLIEIRTL